MSLELLCNILQLVSDVSLQDTKEYLKLSAQKVDILKMIKINNLLFKMKDYELFLCIIIYIVKPIL